MNKLIFGGSIIIGAIFWCAYYVIPHDEARYEILDCMNAKNDRSIESYERCFEKLRDDRRGKVIENLRRSKKPRRLLNI